MDIQHATILIVDDDAFLRAMLERLLGQLKARAVVSAETGERALELLETHPDTIDLMICDIEMPGMTGFELARKVRYGVVERYRHPPILML
ncbi:MAG: response regulator, partial [Alphaproteobacteria bacterium]|nr:response regulator [Alphaproteobacteria bacterium]